MADEAAEASSSEPGVVRTKPEVVEISSRENTEVEQTRVVTKDHTDVLPVALKKGFLSDLTSTRNFLEKKRIVP